jgi:hypothetical protein
MAQASEVFLFQPTSIPGCQLWLDAADRSSLSLSGNNVNQWNDKSGSSLNFTGGVSPSYVSNGLNTNGLVRFISGNYLQSPSVALYSSPSSGGSFFFVFQTTNNEGQKFLLTYQNQTSGVYCQTESEFGIDTGNTTGSGNFGAHRGCSYASVAPANTIANSTFYIMNLILLTTGVTPNNVNIFQNGNTLSVSNDQLGFYSAGSYPSANNSRTFILGARFLVGNANPDSYFTGDIAEVIWYRQPVTTLQRQQIEGYLAWKWGLQGSLPSNHPFKTYRPLAATPIPTSIPPMPITGQTIQPFLPTQVPNINAWYDGADPLGTGILPTLNVSLATWFDKSGNGRNASGGTSPTFVTGGVSFNGTSQFYNFSVPYSSNYSIFLVATNTTAAQCYYFSRSTVGAGQPSFIQGYIGSGIGLEWFEGNDRATLAVTPASPFLASVDHTQGTNILGWYFGNQSFTIPQTQAYNSAPWDRLGQAGINVGWYGGIMRELIFYNAVVTTTQRQQIEGYLAWKWGLVSSLPNGHPYKVQQIAPFSFRTTPFRGSLSTWQPTQISGCQVWLDAADPSTLTLSGSSVTQWRDKSGQGYILTVPSGRVSPTYSNGVLNTTGAAALWTTTNFSISGNARVTLFLVYSTTTTAGLNGPGAHIGSANAATPPTYFGIVTYQTSSNAISFAPTVFEPDVYITLTPNTGGARMMACGFYTGSQINGTYNGTLLTPQTLTTANFGAQPFQIGLRTANNPASVDGTICESVCYNSALSTAQRQQVEGYLAWKWGLVGSLPANHPYRLFPPSP